MVILKFNMNDITLSCKDKRSFCLVIRADLSCQYAPMLWTDRQTDTITLKVYYNTITGDVVIILNAFGLIIVKLCFILLYELV